MVKSEKYPISAEEKASQMLDEMARALSEAAAAVAPGEIGKPLLEIFPEPGERRADTEFVLPKDQETAFREAMDKLGIGRETNQNATEVGLKDNYIAIIEGGQAHKMLAELNVVLGDEQTKPHLIIITGTPDRTIPPVGADKVAEREVTARVLGIKPEEVGATEFDVAEYIATHIPGLRDWRRKGLHGFEQIGTLGDTIIETLRVDRDPLRGGGTKGVIKNVDRYHYNFRGDFDIGFVTSATYQPSREVDAVSAMLEINLGHRQLADLHTFAAKFGVESTGGQKNVSVITYGTAELAKVKSESQPTPPALGQLAGEAHKAAQQLVILRNLLNPPEQA